MRKVFGAVDHTPRSNGFTQHGVPSAYVELFKILYMYQSDSVHGSVTVHMYYGMKHDGVFDIVIFNCALDVEIDYGRGNGFLKASM